MAFGIDHTVRFHETDGAGVVYFANGLVMCHIAYEASLEAAGVDLGDFFRATTVAYPVVHAQMDYRRPMYCGDRVHVKLTPTRLDQKTFEVTYQLTAIAQPETLLAQAVTRHVCIDVQTRRPCPLPSPMEHWIQQWGIHGR
ncbi:thioesterase family protein [Nodosilinea sp. P-1105]|uniref:acyl-CoA thioesterase n=1 Tax=Nodosilinea sp. P-1105 TaxID=2546229 RepID=UPI00146F291A|nr:thioesterase family protein [Nodosilinea sp. P-1105]NMF84039.1 acyl-CoA thioesterase [Nodosilinea sp. P-1105]